MELLYIATGIYLVIFLAVILISFYISHTSKNPKYIAAWWLGILLHIVFPLAFMAKTDEGYTLDHAFGFKEIDTTQMVTIFIIEFILGIFFMWIIEKTSNVPEKIIAALYCVISYGAVYALTMIFFLVDSKLPLFWVNGLMISVLFYISFISNNQLNLISHNNKN